MALGPSVTLYYADQGNTSERPSQMVETHGFDLREVKLGQAKRGFVLLPRRWVVERNLVGGRATSAWPAITDASP